MIHLHDKTFEPFISSEEISFAIVNMAKQMDDDFFDETEGDEMEEPTDASEAIAWYYTLSIPKDRTDPYCPKLVSNATDESGLLKEMELPEGTFFVELMDWDGLGYCQSEEDIEILYKALTGKDLEN